MTVYLVIDGNGMTEVIMATQEDAQGYVDSYHHWQHSVKPWQVSRYEVSTHTVLPVEYAPQGVSYDL